MELTIILVLIILLCTSAHCMTGASKGGGGGGGKAQTTIIDIPIPKVDTTELEVVHVFPQGMGGNGGYGGYNNYPNGIPSFSVVSQENGTTQTSNVWGFNPGSIARKLNKKGEKSDKEVGSEDLNINKQTSNGLASSNSNDSKNVKEIGNDVKENNTQSINPKILDGKKEGDNTNMKNVNGKEFVKAGSLKTLNSSELTII